MDVLYLESFKETLKPIGRVEMDFSKEMEFKHVLPHIHVKITKFDLSNFQMKGCLEKRPK